MIEVIVTHSDSRQLCYRLGKGQAYEMRGTGENVRLLINRVHQLEQNK